VARTLPRLVSAALGLLALASCREDPGSEPFDAVALTVDAQTTAGEIRALHDGVNAGPYSYAWDDDLSDVCDEVGLRWFRTHDLAGGEAPSAGDLAQIYGDTDEGTFDDPANYDFTMIDPLIATAVDNGYSVVYRLGNSWGYEALEGDTRPDRWAEVADRVIRHFNDGWPDGQGHEYGIRHWEIFNEPDFIHFWDGTQAEWFAFFEEVYTFLNERHPDLEIGCCGFATSEWRTAFLQYCDERDIDPDFISWHDYDESSPGAFAMLAGQWQEQMDARGMTGDNVLSEWGMWSGGAYAENGNAHGAAFYANALIELQDSPVDLALRYRFDGLPDTFLDDNGFSMVNPDHTPKIPTLPFKAFHWLTEETPVRLAVEGEEIPEEVGVIAGRSEDGQVVQVLVSDRGSDKEGFRLELASPPWGLEPTTVQRFVIDDDHRFEEVEAETRWGNMTFDVAMTPPQAQLLRIAASP